MRGIYHYTSRLEAPLLDPSIPYIKLLMKAAYNFAVATLSTRAFSACVERAYAHTVFLVFCEPHTLNKL